MASDNEKRTVVIVDTSKLPPVLLEMLSKNFLVESSTNQPAYTFSFLTSNVTVSLFDYSYYLKKLWKSDTQGGSITNHLLARLNHLIMFSSAPYVLFLGEKVDDFLPSFIYELSKSIAEISPGKFVLYGFSTSWKDVANHLLEISKKLDQISLEAEDLTYQRELDRLIISHLNSSATQLIDCTENN